MPTPQHITLLFAAADREETADLRQHLEQACRRAAVQFDGSHALTAGTTAADELARSVVASCFSRTTRTMSQSGTTVR